MRKIKCDDEVIVIAGRDKGKRGKVLRVLENNRLIVSGVQMVKKHQKPNPQAGVAGGIVEKEAPNIAIRRSDGCNFGKKRPRPACWRARRTTVLRCLSSAIVAFVRNLILQRQRHHVSADVGSRVR